MLGLNVLMDAVPQVEYVAVAVAVACQDFGDFVADGLRTGVECAGVEVALQHLRSP